VKPIEEWEDRVKKVSILFIALTATIGLAEAKGVSSQDAVAIAQKLCAKQIPRGASTVTSVGLLEGGWHVDFRFYQGADYRAVGVVIPYDGTAPKACAPVPV
jgi:hypothetical protein